MRLLSAATLALAWNPAFADGAPVLEPVPITGAYAARQVADRDHISIIEMAGNYNRKLDGGTLNVEPRAVVAREFLRAHPDQYDFIVVFSGFEFDTGDALALHWGVQNKVKGIGLPQYDNTALFGSQGRLQGYIDMAALSRYVTDPLNPEFETVLSVLAHEVLHQWAAHVRFRDADGTLSDALLGRDGAHWSFLLHSNASVGYGNLWKDNGDGSFTSTGVQKFFSPLDLYLMGFYKPEEVPPFFLIDNPAIDKTRLPQENVTISGAKRWVAIDDIVAAEGPREPAAESSQKEFRLGFVFLTGPNQTVSDAQIAALNHVRTAFMTRFAVLTGGRAVAQIYPEAMPEIDTGAPDIITGGELRTDPTSLDAALAWLRGQQRPEGHWLDKDTTDVRDTAIALQTLVKLDPAFTGQAPALAWLAQNSTRSTDYLARHARALAELGGDASSLRTQLLSRRNADGGFGIASGYQSDPLDTALAILALAGTAEGGAAVLDAAAQYLIARQNPDGGFSPADGGPSRTSATATVLDALEIVNKHPAAIPGALAFLAAKQNPDGGFGDSPSTVHDTAQVMLTLMRLDALSGINSEQAAAYVIGRQTVDGSFAGSVYSTALAVDMLKRFNFANWAVGPVIVADPAVPYDGDRVTLSITVRNDSNVVSPEGRLRVYDGEPASGGRPIGPDLVVPLLSAGGAVTFTPLWDTLDKAGTHKLVAMVDPDDGYTEMSERDNRGELALTVKPAPAGIDLAITNPDITIMPGQPIELPITLGLTAHVRNTGQTDATNVNVRLWEEAIDSGRLVSETQVDVLGRSTVALNFIDVLAKPGTTTYLVQVDADGGVGEVSETNNIASASVTTAPSVDLEVTPDDISLNKSPVYVGDDVVFTVRLRNRGTVESPTTSVRYFISDGTTTSEIRENAILIAAGTTIQHEVPVRVERRGTLTFSAQIDGTGTVPETDESNNAAAFTFIAGAPSGVNLVINYTDITHSPNPGAEGKPLMLSALVRNTGTDAALNAEVAFYNGDPQHGGELIGVETIPTIAGGGEYVVSAQWPQVNEYGDKLIFVSLDPSNKITEFSETDNQAFSLIEILALPDLVLSPADVVITPGFPRADDAVVLSARIGNLGQQAATNVTVRMYEGAPEAGGPLLGEQVIPSIAGNSTVIATAGFTFPTAGARAVVVQVDPDNAIVERNETNNRAQREIAVQDGDFYVTERYFSPNGDNVKDSTRFFFRLRAPADVSVMVVNETGKEFRRYTAPEFTDADNGSIEWDGRDERGRVVPDGDYRMQVVAASGEVRGEAITTVDTNRSSILEAAGTRYGLITDLSFANYNDPVVTEDEAWIYYRRDYSGYDGPKGIYRRPMSGGAEEPVVPASWFGEDKRSDWVGLSGDGHVVPFSVHLGVYPYQELWAVDRDGKNLRKLKTPVGYVYDGYYDYNRPIVARSGEFVLMSARYYPGGSMVTLFPTDGVSPARIIMVPSSVDGRFDLLRLSPDDKKLVVIERSQDGAQTAFLVDIAAGARKELAKHDDEYSYCRFPCFRYAWSPDGTKLALTDSFARRVHVFDGNGTRLHELEWGDAGAQANVDVDPQWSTTGTEFAFQDRDGKGIYHVDTTAATITEVARIGQSLPDGSPALTSENITIWVPGHRILLHMNRESVGGVWATYLDEGNALRRVNGLYSTTDVVSRGWWWLDDQPAKFSPTGRKLLYFADTNPNDSYYARNYASFESLLNMVVDLRAVRVASSSGIQLQGTAADRNFASYFLDYSSANVPDVWSPIAPAYDQPLIDGTFTTWVPPGPGAYYVRLTAADLAGNERRAMQRVTWGETPEITDVYRTPAIISPNGDGEADHMALRYRVMQPTHLEVNIYNAAGEGVRSFEQNHSRLGEEIELLWDGRDSSGSVVPDGTYRIAVQKYEFFVEVDNTPPEITLALADAYQHITVQGEKEVVVAPALNWSVKDPHYLGGVIETTDDPPSSTWRNFAALDANLAADGMVHKEGLRIHSYSQHRFRLEARDLAGNRAVVATPFAPEQIFIVGVGPLSSTTLARAPYVPMESEAITGPVVGFDPAAMGFHLAETVSQELVDVKLQYRRVDEDVWHNAPVYQPPGGVPPAKDHLLPENALTPHELRFAFASDALAGGQLYVVRVRATGQDATVYYSNAFQAQVVESLGITQHKFLNGDLLVTGVENIFEPMPEVGLYLQSNEDARYAQAQGVGVVAYPEAGKTAISYAVKDVRSCMRYTAHLVGRTSSGRVVNSAPYLIQAPCLTLETKVIVGAADTCGGPSPQRVQIEIIPKSLDGTPLKLLTLGRQDGAFEDVVFNVNQPASAQKYYFDLDTSEMPDGRASFMARLLNTENQESEALVDVVVDHTRPALAITYPAPRQQVCGTPRTLPDGTVRNVLDVAGEGLDAGGFDYVVEWGYGENPVGWKKVSEGGVARSDQSNEILKRYLLNSYQGTWGTIGEAEPIMGEITARVRAFDRGGFQQCTQRTFVFDGKVEAPDPSVDIELFSPNGDDVLEQVTVSYMLAESAVLDAEVYQATRSADGNLQINGPVVRRLESTRQLQLGTGSVVWDGYSDGGVAVADGWYGVALTFKDGCGNSTTKISFVEVDRTAPRATISYPRTGDPLTTMIEVVGSVVDKNLSNYTVSFGSGAVPEQWVQLLTGTKNVTTESVLATWNTFGLEGEYALRITALDRAGNTSELLVPLQFSARTTLISAIDASPVLLSPNGDGLLDTTTIRVGIEQESLVTLKVLDATGAAVRVLAQNETHLAGTSIFVWDGRGEAGASVSDGGYTIQLALALATNPAIKQEEKITVNVDTTPPALAITYPRNGFATSAGRVTGSIIDEHLRDYRIEITATPQSPDWVTIANGETEVREAVLASLEGLGEGDYALRVSARDHADNAGAEVVPFRVDNTKPKVALTAPLQGAVFGETTINVAGEIEESNIKVYTLKIGAGDAPQTWGELVKGSALPLPSVLKEIDVASLADGSYTLWLEAEDKAGLIGDSRVAITVDNTPPVAIITTPAENAYVKAPSDIIGSATDADLGEYSLEVAPGLKTEANRWSPIGGGTSAVTDGPLLSWDALPPDGPQTLRLKAKDKAGNEAKSLVQVTVDTQPPAGPQGLESAIEGGRDVRLRWQASAEDDVAGYAIYRDGVRLNAALVGGTEYLDVGLTEGRNLYTVTAWDHAGWESAPSVPADVVIDLTPPLASIQAPADSGAVMGLVDIIGTAHSDADFREYRLYVGEGAAPTDWQLLRRSPVAVRVDVLSQWDTFQLPENAVFSLKLEAEDLNGNVATAKVSATVNNLPPNPPKGLSGTATGSEVQLTWNANTESDLLGYLLFRGDRLVNASGTVIGDLKAYVIKGTQYLDSNVADGSHIYSLVAMDAAGNMSAPSDPASIAIDTHAPKAVVTKPVDGGRSDQAAYFVAATSPDSDIAQVRLQYKAVADTEWTDIGTPDMSAPYESIWDVSGLAFGYYQLRAVATDLGGKTDDDPAVVTVQYTDLTPPAEVTGLQAQANGGDATLTWEARTETDLAGYHVYVRKGNSAKVRITSTPLAAATYVNTDLSDAIYAYSVTAIDVYGNESIASTERSVQVFTPSLVQPYTPTPEPAASIEGESIRPGTVMSTVAGPGKTAELPSISTDAQGKFVLGTALDEGDTTVTVRVIDADGNVSKPASVTVTHATAPSPPTGLGGSVAGYEVTLGWNDNPEGNIVGYQVFRDGEPVLSEAKIAGLTANASSYQYYFGSRPALAVDGNFNTSWSPSTSYGVIGSWIAVEWAQPQTVTQVSIKWYTTAYRAIDYDIEAWTGSAWLPVVHVRDNEQAYNQVRLPAPYRTSKIRLVVRNVYNHYQYGLRLTEIWAMAESYVAKTAYTDTVVDGSHQYTVAAVNTHGFASRPSVPAELAVGDVTSPEPVALSAVVSGADVALTWSASSSPDVARYDIYRDGLKIAEHTDVLSLNYLDGMRPNGTYTYVITALDAVGNESAPSNQAAAAVAIPPPAAPSGLTATAVPTGNAIDLSWSPGESAPASYRVLRASKSGGPYAELAHTSDNVLHDTGLENGAAYFYVVVALDAYGNVSPHSNEARGVPQDVAPPITPYLHYPTEPGRVYLTDYPFTRIYGTTEPGAQVSLYQGGEIRATTVATATVERQDFSMWVGTPATFASSPNGRYLVANSGSSTSALLDIETGQTTFLPSYWGVTLSSDGELIVLGEFASASGRSYLLTQGVADGSRTPLTDTADADMSFGVLSPDGTLLAALGTKGTQTALFRFDIAAKAYSPLVAVNSWSKDIDLHSVIWSPDGVYVAYIRTQSGRKLELVNVTTGAVHVVDDSVGYSKPIWSPGGEILLYTSTRSGEEQIWRYAMATGIREAITSGTEKHAAPVWSPDGRAMAYIKAGQHLIVRDAQTGNETILVSEPGLGSGILEWGRSGYLFCKTGDSQVSRIAPPGRFEYPPMALDEGDNLFAAVARDAAGNDGSPSAGVVVTYDLGKRADLVVLPTDLVLLPATPLTNEVARVTVKVRNSGAVPSTPAPLSLLALTPSGGSVALITADIQSLAPGEAQVFFADWIIGDEAGVYTLVAVVDSYDILPEVSESNNVALREMMVTGDAAPALTVRLDRSAWGADEVLAGSVTVANSGDTVSGSVIITIEDEAGYVVQTLSSTPTTIAYGQTHTLPVSWSTGATFAGGYRVSAKLVNDQGALLAQDSAPFTLMGASDFTAEVTTDRAAYGANDDAVVTGNVVYRTGNAVVSQAKLRLIVQDAQGRVLAEKTEALGDLLPGAEATVTLSWNTGLAVGPYTAHVAVETGEALLAQAQTAFTVENSGPQLKGTLLLSDAAPAPGTVQQAAYVIENVGNGPAGAQPIRLTLSDAHGQVLATESRVLDLAPGARSTGTVSFATTGLALARYQVQLEAEARDAPGTFATLATAVFTLVDRTAPALALTAPTDNGYLAGNAPAIAFARDELSSVQRVEIRLDGGNWLPATVHDAMQSLYAALLPFALEGVHTVEARAVDAYGNTAVAGPVAFVVDDTAPQIAITGVANDGLYNHDVSASVAITDAHLTESLVALNGAPYAGTAITQEGSYQLVAEARDAADNTSRSSLWFAIDKTAPVISVTGVEEGGLYNRPVTPLVTVTDPHLVREQLALNGEPYASGTPVTADGRYTLLVSGEDGAGNTAAVSVTFEIDATAPSPPTTVHPGEGETVNERVIDVAGMSEPGATVYLVYAVSEVAVFADAEGAFRFPQVAFAEGENSFSVYAKDRAGNVGGSATVRFNVVTAELTGSVRAPTGVLAFVPVGEEAEDAPLRALVEATLTAMEADHLVVRDETAFLQALRTNRYATVLLAELHPGCTAPTPAACGGQRPRLKLSPATEQELRASIAAGLGLVWIKPDSDANERFSDVLGAKPRGLLPAPTTLTLETSPASAPGQWPLAGVALRVQAESGSAVGDIAPYDAPALVLHTYGAGPVVLVAFDPAALAEQDAAQALLARLFMFATPAQRALLPGGLAEVSFRASKLRPPVNVRFEETLASPLVFLAAFDGDITTPATATWTRALANSETSFTALVRLPMAAGDYDVTGALYEQMGDGVTPLKTHALAVTLDLDSDKLAAAAMESLAALVVSPQDAQRRDQAISLVHEATLLPRTSAGAAEAIDLLLDAVAKLRPIPGSAASIGAVGRLLQVYQLAWADN